jgi:hypothetical protein
MGRTLRILAAALALGLASAAHVQARSIPDDGVSIDDVVAWLKDQGQDAKATDDGNGHRIVSSTLNGVKFGVYMFDCKGAKCGSIQFAAGFPANGKIPVSRVNEWNRTKRWARAYLDTSNGIWLESDVDLTPGGTYELLNDNFATWKKTVDGFKEFFKVD